MLKPIQIEALKLMLELVNSQPDIFSAEAYYYWTKSMHELGDESICEEVYRVFDKYAKYIQPELKKRADDMIAAYFGE